MLPAEHTLFERLNQLIEQHLTNQDYSIDALCQELGVSRSFLFRLVKEQTGMSIARHIRQQRLIKARHLLGTTDLRVSDIAFQVGFDRLQTLSKHFTEAFGLSPSEYRSQLTGTHDLPDAFPEAAAPEPETSAVTETRPQPELPPATDLAAGKPSAKLWYWLAVPALLLILLAGSSWWFWKRSAGETDDASIAVLPFRHTGPAESQYFTEGIMEQIHRSLSYLENLKVISRNSAKTYANTTKHPAQIGRELDVAYLLEGKVVQMGKRIKLSVELIRVSENRTVWSKVYEGDQQSVLDFTNQVTNQTAAELNQKLSALTRKQLTQTPTRNIDAYREYLKGEYLLRDRTRESVLASVQNFDRALTYDPAFVDARAARAMAYFLIADDGFGPMQHYSNLAEQEALESIRLDVRNARAYTILAKMYMIQGKWKQANTAFLTALQYSPNDAQVLYAYSLFLRAIGQINRAVDYSTKALALDPLYPVIMFGHVGNLVTARRWAEAERVIQDGNRLYRTMGSWYYSTSFYYLSRRQYALSLREIQKGLRLEPTLKPLVLRHAFISARLQQPKPAQALLDSLPDNIEHYIDKAELYAGLQDKDRCLAYLQKGAAHERLPNYLKVTPLYDFLHNDPRFKALLRQVGLAEPLALNQ
ncbi:helix-turn-helix domain-containing protein [Arsenicibacter rosenii]|uniref:HTH araC/xylS-type domain-containing protein n=1 Tax=Arsenicibacter rosenii TaxID=1750698 RepID=A0A1S2VNZ9_9BACT|nr:helix-turn-helix domain-containing protein [Arsenicibacter rosenii]OIN60489.1 hypothetical protein BLX24_06630 [Arsenicibacter rosenii]